MNKFEEKTDLHIWKSHEPSRNNYISSSNELVSDLFLLSTGVRNLQLGLVILTQGQELALWAQDLHSEPRPRDPH